mmetsp:Transcript_27392/g.60655  ORF Transcript_27392/g.60655 Transcript_27392/m.60655 type:complete len:390 (-) Transcript_27392:586-1755(-)
MNTSPNRCMIALILLFAVTSVAFKSFPAKLSSPQLQLHKSLSQYKRLAPIATSTQGMIQESKEVKAPLQTIRDQALVIWDFSRPHTIIGSCISIICLFLFAVPASLWRETVFLQSLVAALVPSLFMNLFITGLNQITDVDIDKINKPYLPIASGKLSKSNGTLVVLASLFMSVCNIRMMRRPLQVTLLGSALLGTAYSMPPFRLKRFPLLAAFCILVVRGSLVNLGFFLQAKDALLGETLPPLAGGLSSLLALANLYPDAAAITSFFAVFGLVIALMKDVPDIRGDVVYAIPSFSVTLGAARMFRIAWGILFGLLSAASFATLATTLTASTPTRLARTVLSAVLGGFAFDVRSNAIKVEAENPDKVFKFYMRVWNIFYGSYLLLPFYRL